MAQAAFLLWDARCWRGLDARLDTRLLPSRFFSPGRRRWMQRWLPEGHRLPLPPCRRAKQPLARTSSWQWGNCLLPAELWPGQEANSPGPVTLLALRIPRVRVPQECLHGEQEFRRQPELRANAFVAR